MEEKTYRIGCNVKPDLYRQYRNKMEQDGIKVFGREAKLSEKNDLIFETALKLYIKGDLKL